MYYIPVSGKNQTELRYLRDGIKRLVFIDSANLKSIIFVFIAIYYEKKVAVAYTFPVISWPILW
jgi:hypothetical protein